MKILMLSEDFLPNVGGITSHIVYLSKFLVELGHQVTILKPSQKEEAEFIHDFGFKVIHLKGKRSNFFNKIYIRGFIKNLFEKEGFDILHCHQLIGYETKFLKNIPKIFTNHTSMYLEEYEKIRGRIRLKLMLNHVDAIISPSKELQHKSSIIKNRVGNFYIPNGVDEKRFIDDEVEHTNSKFDFLLEKKDDGEVIILCPRRLEPKCGVQYFVESIPLVLKDYQKCHFVIAGRGGFFDEEDRLKGILDQHGALERVSFLGDIDNSDMPFLYQMSDIVAFPSLMEATSISCLEAMSSGKAIVSTDVGGLPELIDDNIDGLLIKPRYPKAMAEKILQLINDVELRNSLGKKARKKVEENFSWSKIAGKREIIYHKVLNSKGF